MHKLNWDDLRYILAVAETGSVSQAARKLGVNHATVLRRVSDFERRHGAAIFEKTTRGYRVLADKRDVIKASKAAEDAIAMVEQLAGGHAGALRGKSRVTSTDTFCQVLLPGIVSKLQTQRTGLLIEIVSSNAHVDLARHRIDIAIRPALELGADLEGEIVADLGFAVYSAVPENLSWLGLSGSLARSVGARWVAENIADDQVVAEADSFHVLRELSAVGCGRAILPCFIGDSDTRLQRVKIGIPRLEVPIWVASHVDHSRSARIQLLRKAFVEALLEKKDILHG